MSDIFQKVIKEKEHERLIRENNVYLEDLIRNTEEIKRLTNIIEKLEMDIEISIGKYEYDTDYNRGLCDAFVYIRERLQDIKGGYKNDKS